MYIYMLIGSVAKALLCFFRPLVAKIEPLWISTRDFQIYLTRLIFEGLIYPLGVILA
jgi:hypothetical protein